ncbi:MAG: YfhO family protein [Chloroflexota bacterium]|nr:YfhO family protein [Chloroflexota bacterium]
MNPSHRRSDLLALGGIALFVLLLLWKILLTNKILVGLDLFTYFYPYRAYVSQALRSRHLPLWNPYLFCGAPLLANPQAAVLYPLHWPLMWLEPPKMIAWSMAIHLWLAGAFAYAYARRSLRLSPFAAFGGALAFVGGGFMGAQAEQINQLNTTAWLPLALLLLDEADSSSGGRRRRWTVLLSLTIALQFLAGHTQAFYINMVALGLSAMWPGVEWVAGWVRRHQLPLGRPPIRGLLIYGLAALLGLGLAGAQLLPTLELSRLSVRGGGLPYRQAVSFSLNPKFLLLTLMPTFGSEELFGEQIGYLGILPLALALVGLLGGRGDRRWGFIVCLTIVGLALALGGYNPLYFILYKVLPGIALFRAPSRWLAFYAFGGAMLAGMGLQQLGQGEERTREKLRRLLPWMGSAAALALALPIPFFLSPTMRTLLVWSGLGLMAGVLLWLGLCRRLSLGFYRLLLVLTIASELVAAGRKLPYNHPTAPQAYSFLQPSLAFLRTEGGPFRFMSITDPQFDPGNTPDIRAIFSSQLSPDALYDYIVAAKWKATLERNLPLRYRVASVDGYDGGVLPLKSFRDLQRLFVPKGQILADGRLRERLKRIPDGRLLSLLNVKYVITDKVHDLWIKDVYYDLAHEAVLGRGEEVEPATLPVFPATGLGMISFLEGAEEVEQGTPVAEVRLADEEDEAQRLLILAGVHTAEGKYIEGKGADYVAQFSWQKPIIPQQLTVRSLLPEGRFHIRALTLIDHRVGAFEPVVISTEGRYRLVHSGALKIYENLDVFPRAFFSPHPTPQPPLLSQFWERGEVLSYTPERVVIQTEADQPGYLILTDAFYPGWQATVDGTSVPILQAEPYFRAVRLEAGQHQVEFTYEPLSLRLGAALSGLSLLIALLGARVNKFTSNE